MEDARAWQTRPLDDVYPVVFLAALVLKIRDGGSVQADNAEELMSEPNVDGLLVGGASLQAGTFLDVIRACGACYRS